MTTAGQFRALASSKNSEVQIAGVPWPVYKVAALVVGLVVAVLVGVVTSAASAAVLAGAGIATIVWLLGSIQSHHR
jgi:hypothetical protein